MAFTLPEVPLPDLSGLTSEGDELLPNFRFGVCFLPYLADLRFQKVSGLSATVETEEHPEGGQNLYTQKLPKSVTYDNLVLERGMVVGSWMNIGVNLMLSTFKFVPSTVLVTLFKERSIAWAGWLFINAYPVRWSTSDLDAEEKSVMIESLELAYARMQFVRI